MALLTPADFSAGTGGKIAADDPRVQPLLDGAEAAVRRYCGWHIAPVTTQTIKLDGPGGSLLSLPTLRLVDITALSEVGNDLDVDELEWSEKGMIRRRSGCWTDRFRGLVITMEHGFDSADDVKQIIQQVVANAIASPLGATSESAGALSVSWASTAPGVSGGLSLLARDFAVLDMYRLPKEA